MWTHIVDHYFDHIHWEQANDAPLKLKHPTHWVAVEYGATVDMSAREIYFKTEKQRTWFAMRWMS
jgi:hypothetical protein